MKPAYLSLGSNAGDRERALREALRLLEAPGLHVKRLSSVYETEPIGVSGQPWFLNLVVEVETELFPMQLLARTQKIERELGRKRKGDLSPRTIDIDILLFGNFVVTTPELTIPHPRMTERRFVLEPLVELAPDLRHPVSKRAMKELLSGVQNQGLRRTDLVIRGARHG